MTIGSLDTWYTSGSLYKKFGGSEGSRYNKQSVASFDAEVARAGSTIFGQAVEESYGLSELAAQSMRQRVASELSALADEAELTQSSALNILA